MIYEGSCYSHLPQLLSVMGREQGTAIEFHVSFSQAYEVVLMLLPFYCWETEAQREKPHFQPNLLPKSLMLAAAVVNITKSCPTLCDAMDYSQLGSSIHGIFQVRILGWVAISFSRGSSRPRDRTWFSCVSGGFCYIYNSCFKVFVCYTQHLGLLSGNFWCFKKKNHTYLFLYKLSFSLKN